jgi:hypothetical protein
MNFVDYTLARLANDGTREAMFDQDALQQLLAAAYDAEALSFEAPFVPLFERLTLGISLSRRSSIEGRWGELTDPQRNQLLVQWDGDASPPLRVDALWQGAIAAQVGGAQSRVERVATDWPDVSTIDADIVVALGALPADSAALEAARRTRLLARWRAGALQPAAFTDATLDAALAAVGAATVSELITRDQGTFANATVQVAFSDPQAAPPELKPLPICAAMLIRDAPIDLAGMLADSRRMRELLRTHGVERPPQYAAAGQVPVIVAWVIPAAVFDDPDWPGATDGASAAQQNAQRRLAASSWLTREAIGLMTPPPRPA